MERSEDTREREKVHYSVWFVPDGEMGAGRRFSIRFEVFVAFLAAVVLLLIAALAYCFILAGELSLSNHSEQELKTRNEILVKQQEELLREQEEVMRENEELQEKVSILSDTINDKVKQEQEREAEIAKTYLPTGFPLEGTAFYNKNETELDGNPVAMFQASKGTSVVATANGTVHSITGDMAAGYVVMIDHGNGYYSVYRNRAMPKVKEGDPVTNKTVLFGIEEGNETLGYQIIENGEYIDPLNFMETYG